MDYTVKISNLNFSYNQDPVLVNVNVEIPKGELAVIVGENGSGKSTLLKLILGELKPSKGSVSVLGAPAHTPKMYEKIGYVPQNNAVNRIAFPVTCLEMVVLNRYRQFGLLRFPKKKDKAVASEILKKMGLGEYINTPFNELSGGLQQRVMIARALLNSPELLILDEPTAGIDKESKALFLEILSKLQKEKDLTILLVSHEPDLLKNKLPQTNFYQMKEGTLNHVNL